MKASPDPLSSLLVRCALLIALLALAASVAYALFALVHRPWDTVEGEVLFEASRLRHDLPLYVDPRVGAFDYGPVPARYYVLYPPLWSWLLSHVPEGAASQVARGFDIVAWFGLLAFVARTADAGCKRAATAGAIFVGGVYTLTLYGASGRPDSLAQLLAGIALVRAARLGRIDPLSAALFALAPWVKPNVLGMAAGAFALDLGLRRVKALLPLGIAALTSLAILAVLHVASSGAWITHLLRSTGQPLSAALWAEQVPSRLQFLGIPLAFAAACGWRARRDPKVSLGLAAVLASVLWALFSLAKIGSATNYWMEPSVACLIVMAHAPVPSLEGRARIAAASVAVVQALWTGVATIRSSLEQIFVVLPSEDRSLARARVLCNAGPGDVVLGDETGIELRLDGRIVATPFQMTHLARRGLYPLETWTHDVTRPEVVGIVMEDDLLERPLSDVSIEHDRFGPELRRLLKDRFELAEKSGDWRTYKLRGR